MVAATSDPAEARLSLVEPVLTAAAAVAALPQQAAPAAPDEEGAERARVEAEEAAAALAGLEGQLSGAQGAVDAARAAVERAAELSGGADCPLCGQELGTAFEQVQAHRAGDLEATSALLSRLVKERAAAAKHAKTAKASAAAARQQVRDAQGAWNEWQQQAARRAAAVDALAAAAARLGPGDPDLDALDAEQTSLRRVLAEARAAADEARRLEGRLERRPALEQQLAATRIRADAAGQRLESLRTDVRSLGFDPAALEAARETHDQAAAEAEKAGRKAREARLAAEKAAMHAEAEAKRLADAEAQHAKFAELAEEARHLGRLAELLNAFRNSVVASVGPRLAAQAAELFGELTDQEYDRLEVDPETYELQIRDAGTAYGMARFSGSEIDLANLALRVAISEHVRFQSGGAVGLLVLDEVFGPLDDDRKERMLLALERLKGRFRQILVVTHANEIKEQLPNAIQVVKLTGRRADARLVAG
jgi:DNA repair exonuclease SbcCD ATPase subunit